MIIEMDSLAHKLWYTMAGYTMVSHLQLLYYHSIVMLYIDFTLLIISWVLCG